MTTIFTVPTSKANEWFKTQEVVSHNLGIPRNEIIVTSDEAEAVAMACGHYLATGEVATVVMGENGLLNALDAIITLSQLHQIPIQLELFPRNDEPQHAMITAHLGELLDLFKIQANVHA